MTRDSVHRLIDGEDRCDSLRFAWRRFSRVVAVFSTDCRYSRGAWTMMELERVGLGDVEAIYAHEPPFMHRIMREIGMRDDDRSKFELRRALAQIGVIRQSYDMEFPNLVVVMDNSRFLKDESALHRLLSSVPDDYDFVAMDYRYEGFYEDGDSGFLARDIDVRSYCYAVSRIAMANIVKSIDDKQESALRSFLERGVSSIVGRCNKYYSKSPLSVPFNIGCFKPDRRDISVFNAGFCGLGDYSHIGVL